MKTKLQVTGFHCSGIAPASGAIRRAPHRIFCAAERQTGLIEPAAKINDEGVVDCARGGRAPFAFTLIEVMVAMALLSLIVIALMTVFSSTQAAFRASVTQTDVLESGRATMDLITEDLRAMKQSMGYSNSLNYYGTVNFYVGDNYYGNPPLVQSLVASSGTRTNMQQDVFILSQGNQNGVPTWYGTGYAVCVSPSNTYSLYRFSTNLPVARSVAASNLFYGDFINFLKYPNNPNSGNYSRLLDGVVDFRIRAFDASGMLISTNRTNIHTNAFPDRGYYFYSNALPAAVEIEMATLEDRTLRRADSIPVDLARSNYLSQQAGKVHVFRQRVAIPNVDSSVYQ
ncbi:MAG: hypothetical protein WDM80_16995 [Limisphaerales bacterium]